MEHYATKQLMYKIHFDGCGLRLCCICAWTSVLAASAASKLNSPAIVATATTCASLRAFPQGMSPPPFPIAFRQAACAGNEVPPPTVPTSIEGIVQLIQRSPSFVSSNIVRQLLLSTFCAGSWPVAKNTAVTIFDACALKPPIVPDIADPIRFFCRFVSTIAFTVVLSTDLTIDFGIVASTTTLFPRPSIQFVAAAFLSVHIFPERATSFSVGKC